MLPVAVLDDGDQNHRDITEDDPQVGNERQHNDQQRDEKREIQMDEQGQHPADEDAVDGAHDELPPEERHEIPVDLQQHANHLFLEGRIPDGQVFVPMPGDVSALDEQKEQVDGDNDQVEQRARRPEALGEQVPQAVENRRNLALQYGHLFLDVVAEAIGLEDLAGRVVGAVGARLGRIPGRVLLVVAPLLAAALDGGVLRLRRLGGRRVGSGGTGRRRRRLRTPGTDREICRAASPRRRAAWSAAPGPFAYTRAFRGSCSPSSRRCAGRSARPRAPARGGSRQRASAPPRCA